MRKTGRGGDEGSAVATPDGSSRKKKKNLLAGPILHPAFIAVTSGSVALLNSGER